MLGSPICLFLISHLLFPESLAGGDLSDYYFEMARIIWPIAAATVVIGTFFRPLAFGRSILSAGNLATIPTLLVCLVLASTRSRRIHAALVPALLLVIWLDTILVTAVQS